MVDLNDRFVGLMIGLLIIIAFGLYLVFFTKVEEKKGKLTKPRVV